MKRTESKKSPSRWWDSRISPKSSELLQENVDDRRPSHRKSCPCVPAFDFFLRWGGSGSSLQKSSDENFEGPGKIAKYDEELRVAKEKIQLSGEEISRLTLELQKYKSEAEVLDLVHKIQTLEEELKITQVEVASLRQELTSKGSTIQNLQDQLKSNQQELFVWKNKLEKENLQVLELQDSVARYKTNLSDLDQEIRGLKEAISNTKKSLSEEKEQLQAEITRNQKELDLLCQSLEEDARRVQAGKAEMEVTFGSQIELLKADIADKNESVEELKKNLDEVQLKYDMLMDEKDDLNINIATLAAEVSSKDDQIDQMSKHMHQLHMEHVDLIAGAHGARKLAEELRSRIQEQEREVERKQEIILQGAEEKREAIRQLHFSLEHYRFGHKQAVFGRKGLSVVI
ncbi:hypothetical protein Pfo_006877 [Paulownia fortunei]|nr:hypothetical protein Pfo_006877 [Paulownia fortunei]